MNWEVWQNYSRNYSDHYVCTADSTVGLGLLGQLAGMGQIQNPTWRLKQYIIHYKLCLMLYFHLHLQECNICVSNVSNTLQKFCGEIITW
jgi:hypothetical protein